MKRAALVVSLVLGGSVIACTVMNGLNVPAPADGGGGGGGGDTDARDINKPPSGTSSTSSSSSSTTSSSSSGTSGAPMDDGSTSTTCPAGACIEPSKGCKQFKDTLTCTQAGTSCCVAACDAVAPLVCPPGAVPTKLFDTATKCVKAYECSPVDCTRAGGSCIAAGGVCPVGSHAGALTDYGCVSGDTNPICCLPGS